MSFDKRTYKLTTLTVERFRRLGKGGNKFVDQLATAVVGEADDGNLRRKGLVKAYLQIFPPSCSRTLSPDGGSGIVRHWVRDVKHVKMQTCLFLLLMIGPQMGVAARHNYVNGVGLWKFLESVTSRFLPYVS